MTPQSLNARVFAALAAIPLAACQTTPEEPSEPQIRTVEVVVNKPVPCPALAELGPEPLYPDTDEAIAAADGIGELSQMYRVGRAMRQARLMTYMAVAAACNF
jgi:hypothetical protein